MIINKLKYILTLVILTFVSYLSVSQTLTIACASNFRDPMSHIIKEFKAENPQVRVQSVFGSSGNLYNQITNNAPYDLFFSADTNYPQKIFEAGLSYNSPKIYAIGQLVLWSRRVDISQGFLLLEDKKVKRIAMANPNLAPYGKSAKQCLEYHKLFKEIENKIVTAENIAQTAQFAVTGNADVAFIAKSQLNMKAIIDKGSVYELPSESYDPINQAYVRIRKDGNDAITQIFVAFLNKAEIQQVIKEYGYNLTNE